MKQDHPGLAEAGSELYDGIIQYFNPVIESLLEEDDIFMNEEEPNNNDCA